MPQAKRSKELLVVAAKFYPTESFGQFSLFAVGFNTPQLAAAKLWQRLEFMVVNPTCTKNFLYQKNTPQLAAGIFYSARPAGTAGCNLFFGVNSKSVIMLYC
jgi:hypothetical protein